MRSRSEEPPEKIIRRKLLIAAGVYALHRLRAVSKRSLYLFLISLRRYGSHGSVIQYNTRIHHDGNGFRGAVAGGARAGRRTVRAAHRSRKVKHFKYSEAIHVMRDRNTFGVQSVSPGHSPRGLPLYLDLLTHIRPLPLEPRTSLQPE